MALIRWALGSSFWLLRQLFRMAVFIIRLYFSVLLKPLQLLAVGIRFSIRVLRFFCFKGEDHASEEESEGKGVNKMEFLRETSSVLAQELRLSSEKPKLQPLETDPGTVCSVEEATASVEDAGLIIAIEETLPTSLEYRHAKQRKAQIERIPLSIQEQPCSAPVPPPPPPPPPFPPFMQAIKSLRPTPPFEKLPKPAHELRPLHIEGGLSAAQISGTIWERIERDKAVHDAKEFFTVAEDAFQKKDKSPTVESFRVATGTAGDMLDDRVALALGLHLKLAQKSPSELAKDFHLDKCSHELVKAVLTLSRIYQDDIKLRSLKRGDLTSEFIKALLEKSDWRQKAYRRLANAVKTDIKRECGLVLQAVSSIKSSKALPEYLGKLMALAAFLNQDTNRACFVGVASDRLYCLAPLIKIVGRVSVQDDDIDLIKQAASVDLGQLSLDAKKFNLELGCIAEAQKSLESLTAFFAPLQDILKLLQL